MKKFPIGISTLEKIQSGNFYYVDKTAFVEKLAGQGQYYFLSRPRRFGKSLIIDTLKQAFLGNREIFKGLYLEHHWDWETKYPAIHISFASNQQQTAEYRVEDKITSLLLSNAEMYELNLRGKSYSEQFSFLIQDLQAKYKKKVVILVDEYDKPILDAITDISIAHETRNSLRSFYSVIKEHDDKIQFAFLTGVSKFAKAGVFSGLNNLNDITYDEQYSIICGYTQQELEHTFQALLTPEELPEIKAWYNGYYFLGNEGVYNPFSILNYFAKGKRFSSYWFASGTPTFLIELFRQRRFYIPNLERARISENELESFEIDQLSLLPLLLQTGYLTIKSYQRSGARVSYTLTYPNLEVRHSLNDSLTQMSVSSEVKNQTYAAMDQALSQHHFEKMKDIFTCLFASIPHDWYRNNNIQNYEGFYCATVYSYFMGLGYKAIAEDVTSQGQIDMTIILDNSIVIMEFKLTPRGNAQSALAQIKDRHYADKYLADKKPIYLLALSFNPEKRNVEECIFEHYNNNTGEH
ncbi:MAG: ATP-binding protein [Gammaproteobacteria bacterium]|nr:ATP-binding protein [Gammaproteobacteria bacterium]